MTRLFIVALAALLASSCASVPIARMTEAEYERATGGEFVCDDYPERCRTD